MSIRSFSTDFLYKIDTSEKTNIILTIFQIVATVSAFLYQYYIDIRIATAEVFFYSFSLSQSLVLLFFFIMLIYSGKYRAIKLRLNKNTRVLYDRTTNFRNISLRAKTLNIIFDTIDNSEISYEIGKKAGEDFYNSFEDELQRKGKNYNIEDKLDKWLEYDSSSGMGKFEVHNYEGLPLKLKISSPFIGHCPGPNSPNPRCFFLMGYIDGFCSMLFEKNLKSTCTHCKDPPYCILKLSESNNINLNNN